MSYIFLSFFVLDIRLLFKIYDECMLRMRITFVLRYIGQTAGSRPVNVNFVSLLIKYLR